MTPDSPVAESSTWADGGPDEDTLIPSSPVAETSGSKPVQPDLPAAETPGHSQHSPFAETSGSSRPKPTQSCEVCSYSTTLQGNMYRHKTVLRIWFTTCFFRVLSRLQALNITNVREELFVYMFCRSVLSSQSYGPGFRLVFVCLYLASQ